MTKAKKSKSGNAKAKTKTKRAKAKTDWVGGIKEALAKKQSVQTWPGAGEAWKSKTKPH